MKELVSRKLSALVFTGEQGKMEGERVKEKESIEVETDLKQRESKLKLDF